MKYTPKAGNPEKVTFTYTNGKISTAKVELNDPDYADETHNYEYNAEGRIIKAVKTDTDGITTTRTYKYDNAAQVTVSEEIVGANPALKDTYTYTYTLDGKGNVSKLVKEGKYYKKTTLENFKETTTIKEVDDKSNPFRNIKGVSALSLEWFGNSKFMEVMNNNIKHKEVENLKSIVKVSGYIFEYSYDRKGYPQSSENYFARDGVRSTDKTITTYTYNR